MTRSNGLCDKWLWLILSLSLLLATYHLAYPVWDYHNWRQSITLMLARDFARHNFPVWHPQVSWIGERATTPSYFSEEFSIESLVAALLYKVFGESESLARLTVIAFSLLGIASLYSILKRRAGSTAARFGAIIYALMPYQLFFGRAFMPDIPALALALAGLDALDRWTVNRKTARLAVAGVLTALALLQKLTVIFVALPSLFLFWSVDGRGWFKRREPWIYACTAGLPPLVWYLHAMAQAPQSTIAMPREFFGHRLDLWLDGRFVLQVLRVLSAEALSPLGLALVLIGLVWPMRGRAVWLFRWWVLGALFLLLLVPAIVANNYYYFTLLLPGGAALAGLLLDRVASHPKGLPLATVILVVFAAGSITAALPLYQPDRLPVDLGRVLRGVTQPDDLVATEAGGSPIVLYYADRRGWLLSREYSVERLEQLRAAGARYYADSFLADVHDQRDFFHALERRYLRLTPEDAPWQIFDLNAPAVSPLPLIPSQRGVNFGGQILMRDVSFRPLGGWPPAYEATYEWQCLQAPLPDLRVFVHVTDTAGRTVAQQDHSPHAGWFPTIKWRAGDVLRERYVWVLPATLPGGRYQIRIGWFGAERSGRLPVSTSSAADGEDRPIVAQLDVPPPPRYGWFSVSR